MRKDFRSTAREGGGLAPVQVPQRCGKALFLYTAPVARILTEASLPIDKDLLCPSSTARTNVWVDEWLRKVRDNDKDKEWLLSDTSGLFKPRPESDDNRSFCLAGK